MDLKKELKIIFNPDLKRIVLTLLILFLLSLVTMERIGTDFEGTVKGIPFAFYETTSADVPMPPEMQVQPSINFIFWAFVLDLLILYAVVSIAMYLIERKR